VPRRQHVQGRATATSTRADERWQSIKVAKSETYTWDGKSTYVQNPPYFVGISKKAPAFRHQGARCLACWRFHHYRPHLARRRHQEGLAAGKYLIEPACRRPIQQLRPRRGNHEIMMAARLPTRASRTRCAGRGSGFTGHLNGAGGKPEPIYDAAMKYQKEVPRRPVGGRRAVFLARATLTKGVAFLLVSLSPRRRSARVAAGAVEVRVKPPSTPGPSGSWMRVLANVARIMISWLPRRSRSC